MSGAVFIISEKADRKLVNRLLLYLRAWEYGEPGEYDYFQVITSLEPLQSDEVPTSPPMKRFKNEWAGKSLEDVERFMRQHHDKEMNAMFGANKHTFCVLDDQGIEEGTIILTSRDSRYGEEDESFTWLHRFLKLRLPWEEACGWWSNLDIAHVNFEELVEGDIGEDGWSTWSTALGGRTPEKVIAERSDAIRELQGRGDV